MNSDMKKKWVTILNFIRYDDYRAPELDLFEPVVEQMKVLKKHSLPATWLLQVDAMKLGPYPEFLRKNMPGNHEIGLWFEINRCHCNEAGVKFRGRDTVNWEYHSNASLSVGYTQSERIALADTAMDVFKKSFGHYPETVAAWYIYAFTLKHLKDK